MLLTYPYKDVFMITHKYRVIYIITHIIIISMHYFNISILT